MKHVPLYDEPTLGVIREQETQGSREHKNGNFREGYGSHKGPLFGREIESTLRFQVWQYNNYFSVDITDFQLEVEICPLNLKSVSQT